MLTSVCGLLSQLLQLYQFILLARVLMSWFPNLDRNNPVARLLFDLTEPVLRPVRERLPRGSMVDFSPLLVFFGITILSRLILGFCR